MFLTTAEIMEALSVSRSWVNTHLRQLGSEPKIIDSKGKRAVLYDDAEVLRWINDTAKFSRQTEWVALTDLAPGREQEIAAAYERLKKTPNGFAWLETFNDILDRFLTPEQAAAYATVNERQRGNIPWVQVEARVTAFGQLHTIKELCPTQSMELAYREVYFSGMIRVELGGRRWFIEGGETPEHSILMPVGFGPKR